MSPHKLEVLPSRAALPQYGISKNGFLPEEAPLEHLPQRYYQPWERIMEQLPMLIEKQQIREEVDALPILDTAQLSSEAEWQRACYLDWSGTISSKLEFFHMLGLLLTKNVATTTRHYSSLPPDVRTSRSAANCNVRNVELVELENTSGGHGHYTARQSRGSTDSYRYRGRVLVLDYLLCHGGKSRTAY
jgi:hypothetical protein